MSSNNNNRVYKGQPLPKVSTDIFQHFSTISDIVQTWFRQFLFPQFFSISNSFRFLEFLACSGIFWQFWHLPSFPQRCQCLTISSIYSNNLQFFLQLLQLFSNKNIFPTDFPTNDTFVPIHDIFQNLFSNVWSEIAENVGLGPGSGGTFLMNEIMIMFSKQLNNDIP